LRPVLRGLSFGPSVGPEAHTLNKYKTMKKQLVRISILQSSKIMTALYVLMGCIYTLIGIPMIIFGNNQLRIIGIFYLLGPILAGIFGFIFFVIFAAIYNLLAQWLGGFEVEIKNVDDAASPGPAAVSLP
jgi:uncharacterized membrane protein